MKLTKSNQPSSSMSTYNGSHQNLPQPILEQKKKFEIAGT